jgi:nucleoid-associated protein YgaU
LYGTPPATQQNYVVTAWIVTVDVEGLTVYTPLNIKVIGGNEPPKQLLPVVLPTAVVGQVWTYTVPSGAFTDPDGGALSYSAYVAPPYAFEPNPGQLPLPSWLSFNSSTQTFIGTPPSGGFGEYLELLVSDFAGGSLKVPIFLGINATNQAPTLGIPLANQSAVRGGSWTYAVPADAFTDPEGKALVLSAKQANGANLPAWLTFTPGSRTFTLGALPTAGIYNIRVTATDNLGSGAWVTSDFTLVVSPTGTNPPILKYPVPDQNIKRGTAWTYTFPSYLFVDPENTALAYTATLENGSALPSWLTFPPGTPRTFNATAAAVEGTYRVRVRAQDGSGASAVSVFTLKVHPAAGNAPISVINPIQDQIIPQLSAWSYQLPANIFQDIENQTLFIGEAEGLFTSAEIQMGLPEGLIYNAYTRTISGTPLKAGTFTVTVNAIGTDYDVGTTTFKLIVTPSVTNTAPTSPNAITSQSGVAGQAWQFDVPANTFSDPQAQTLRYSAIQSNGNVMPEWLQFDPLNRRFYGTPTVAGTWTLRVKAEDTYGLSVYRDFSFTAAAAPANQAPILNAAIGTRYGERNGLFAFTVPANTFTDPNGNTLNYSATGLPSWLSFDSLTRTFYGVPTTLKSYSVTLVATDPSGASASHAFTINVNAMAQTQGSGSAGVVTGVVASSTTAVSNAAATTSGPTPEQYWFTYDSENRAEIVNGQLVNGQISLQSTNYLFTFYTPIAGPGAPTPDASYGLRYDAVGRVVAQIYGSSPRPNIRIQHSIYDQRGHLTAKFETDSMLASTISSGSNVSQSTTALWWSGISERRIYDAAGRLLEIREYFTWDEKAATQFINNTSHKYGWLQRAQVVTYNNDNQVTLQQTFGRTGVKWYDAVITAEGSNLTTMISNQTTNRNVLTLLTTTTNTVRGDGLLTHMKFQQHAWEPDTQPKLSDGTYLPAFTHDFDYTYLKRQAYLENTVTGSSTDSRFKPATTTSMYDAYGRRIAVKEHAQVVTNDVVRYFAYDANEGIVSRRDGWLENGNFVQTINGSNPFPLERNLNFVHVNGQQVAKLSQAGEIDIVSNFTAYESGSNTQGYVVQAGDTLQSIAQRVYGDASMWYIVASANSIDGSDQLAVGMRLRTPELKVTSNDSNTLKPYNVNDVIGATTPNMAFIPPAKTGCVQTAATIFSVVIRIVTIIIAAYLTAIGQPGAGRLVAGVGEAFAQGIEIQNGTRENFNWLGVASAAIQGGLSTPVPATKTQAVWRAVIRAAGNYAAGYIQDRLQGNDPTFSWKALAATVVASAIGEAVLGGKPGTPEMAGQTAQRAINKSPAAFNWATVAKEAAKAVARSAIDYAARKVIVGEAHWNWNSVAANALGTGLGQAIGEFVVGRMEERRQDKLAQARKDEEQQRAASSPQYDPNSSYDTAMAEAGNHTSTSPFSLNADGSGDMGLYTGMLDVGNATGAAPGRAGFTTHTVAKGDNLSTLGSLYFKDPVFGTAVLAMDNDIRNPNAIKVGAVLRVRTMYEDGSIYGLDAKTIGLINSAGDKWFAADGQQKLQEARVMAARAAYKELVQQATAADLNRIVHAFDRRPGQTDYTAPLSLAKMAPIGDTVCYPEGSGHGYIGKSEPFTLFGTAEALLFKSDASLSDKWIMAKGAISSKWDGMYRTRGLLQAIGGAGEVGTSVFLAETGVGIPLAIGLAAHGGDNIGTGWNLAFGGAEANPNTVTFQAVEGMTGSREAASIVDTGFNWAGGVGGVGVMANAMKLGSVKLSSSEVFALRTAGLSSAEIGKQMRINGDIYLFRGTSTGWAGSPGAQATAVSATVDPYVATIFALEARGQGGQAVLMFGQRSRIGTFGPGNWMAAQEREVGVLMNADEFANSAPFIIPADNARDLLRNMGMPALPYSVPSPSARSMLLDSAPRMTPEQIAEFIRRTNGGN